MELKEFVEAAQQFRLLLTKDFYFRAAAHRCLGMALHRLGLSNKAERELKLALTRTRKNESPAIYHRDLGLFCLETFRYVEARAELEKAIEASPESFASYWHLAKVFIAQEEYLEAKKALENAVATAPPDLLPPAKYEIPTLLQICLDNLPPNKND